MWFILYIYIYIYILWFSPQAVCQRLEGLRFCEVHHSVVNSTDEFFKEETRLLLLWVDIKTVYKIVKYKTNYLHSISDYAVINWIIEAVLS